MTTFCLKLTDMPVARRLTFKFFCAQIIYLMQQGVSDYRGVHLQNGLFFVRQGKASEVYAVRLPCDPNAIIH